MKCLLAILVLAACGKPTDADITVAAAADLRFAFEELGKAFTAKTGKTVKFSFGSTGQLAQQISNGGPFDVFAAANVSFIDDVVKSNACDGASKAMYARGRIVIWTKQSKGFTVSNIKDLTDAKFEHVAIANPEHAPYGRAAKEALESAGLWSTLKPKIVYGENISQTLNFAETGNAEAAFAALSLATVTEDGAYLLVDDALHKPIDQALVVCKNGHNAEVGKQFAQFVGSEAGRVVMRRYGFLLPGEAVGTK